MLLAKRARTVLLPQPLSATRLAIVSRWSAKRRRSRGAARAGGRRGAASAAGLGGGGGGGGGLGGNGAEGAPAGDGQGVLDRGERRPAAALEQDHEVGQGELGDGGGGP